ncbi:LytTR family DNA-binding domain-containing protein [Paenibacillus sp. JSM ZJ436]|uniref:LytTR family DNA-binding domain-containing protein n=1 Tax=Paenibacillus sp. JSM ZJ436 TaxID=3376190 RepID=UPI0037A7CACF
MKTVPVVKKEGKIIYDTPEFLDIREIICSKAEKISGEYRSVFVTAEGEYVLCTSNDLIAELLAQESEFFRVDRGVVANLQQDEVKIDFKERLIYYFNPNHIIPVAASRIKALKEYVERLLN